MNKTISKNISGLVVIASFAFVMTSCQKENNSSLNEVQAAASARGEHGIPFLSTCAPIPDSLQVPEGNKLVLQTFARGVQIYQVKQSATDPNSFSWVNIAPSATLYAKPGFIDPLINHFAGPSWEFIKGPEKGEKVVARKLQGVTRDATAIQWLLLQAVDSLSTPGNKVTFVQRICTAGGLAPTTGADAAHLNQLDSIPYTASYLFYEKD